MRRLIIFLLFLFASVWFGIAIIRHPGYILIFYQPWMVQMPLWFALISLLIIFGLFYVLISSIDRIHFLWFKLQNWLRFRRERKSYSNTQYGIANLLEARFKKAEKLLLAGVQQTVEPLINYLGAARAAHEQKAYERRDAYLQKAYQVAPDASLAIGITQAELELASDQVEQARAILVNLRQTAPRHPRVLKLLEKVYVRNGDWNNLLTLLPAMRKAKVLTPEEANIFEKNLYNERLKTCANLPEARKVWDSLPKHLKKNPELINSYVNIVLKAPSSINTESAKEVESLIRNALKCSWQPGLARVYGSLPFNNHLNRQLVIVGAWLNMYGQKQELLLTLGKLCVRVKLWGKAKDYFEKCLALGPDAEASLEYGKLLEQLGDTEDALHQYRAGLAQQVHIITNQQL